MPWKPPRRCSSPLCPELATLDSRCEKHRREANAARKQRETWRDYGPEWQNIRRQVLRLEPACRFCNSPATVVDHILPLKDGGTHEPHNLRPLCKSCHDRRTYYDTLGQQPKG